MRETKGDIVECDAATRMSNRRLVRTWANDGQATNLVDYKTEFPIGKCMGKGTYYLRN